MAGFSSIMTVLQSAYTRGFLYDFPVILFRLRAAVERSSAQTGAAKLVQTSWHLPSNDTQTIQLGDCKQLRTRIRQPDVSKDQVLLVFLLSSRYCTSHGQNEKNVQLTRVPVQISIDSVADRSLKSYSVSLSPILYHTSTFLMMLTGSCQYSLVQRHSRTRN